MSAIHDDQTQVLTPPPGKPRKKWHQRWSVRIPLGLAALGLIAGVAGGAGSHPVAASKAATSAPASMTAAQGCKALLDWENNYKGSDTADVSPTVRAITNKTASTQFGTNLAAWIRHGNTVDQNMAAASKVSADCVAVGAPDPLAVPDSSSSDAPSAAPSQAPAPVPAPVFHEKTLLTLSGNGSEDTAPFTIPDGSGHWKIIWTYNEGGFGQSVNFQIWSEDFQANVNKLGTGGSGTEYVYGDPGTHHLTVNSEGAWTIKVVTAP